jgi:hypothetical protein
MATLTATVKAVLAAQYVGAPDLGSAAWSAGEHGIYSRAFTNGTGLNQCNKVFQDHGATGTSYDLDAGTMLDPLGAALAAFSRIVAVMIDAPAANTAPVAVGGDFILSKYLTDWVDDALTIPVHPGGCFLWVAPSATGVAVTATTGDVITVTPSGTEEFDLLILGS